MSAYLKIENVGVCPPEAITVLGVSLADTSGDGNVIGQFGSGSSHAISLCLRNGLSPIIFSDGLRMEFSARSQEVKDDLSSKKFGRIQVKYSGKDADGRSRSSTDDLGFVLEFGSVDWSDISLALREFVSNAIDRTVRETGNWGSVKVEVVDERQVRAKSGTTRVFVPLNAEVLEFYNNLGKWFLHFSEPESIGKRILPKANRNLGNRKAAVIYRRGVRVREFESTDTESLFDYNLNDLRIDEARKASDWDVRYSAARALAGADKEILARFFTHVLECETPAWEDSFDAYGLSPSYGDTTETRKAAWQEAFECSAGERGVVCGSEAAERLTRKGYRPIVLPEGIRAAASTYGVRSAADVLTQDESAGREIQPPTESAQKAVDFVWKTLERLKLTMGKAKPPVHCYSMVMNECSEVLGYYRDNEVYLAASISDTFSQLLVQVAMEEVVHFITKSLDCTRDMQNFAFQLAAAVMMERA